MFYNWDMRYIFHIDVNSAFLSWTAVYRIRELGESEDLRDVPSVIGGDEESRHGIVLAKSTPAKKYGIETAEPIMSARRKCPGLIVAPSDFAVYRRYSHAFMDILRSYATQIHPYSIDEAWAVFDDCENVYGDMVEFAYKLKDEIYDRLGFTVNIGVSTSFLLAKVAGDFEKPNKVHTLFPWEVEEKLYPLPVNVMLYVGKSMKASLLKLGIVTVRDLVDSDPEIISRNLGKFGVSLWEQAHGVDIDPSVHEEAEQKGYGNSTTTPTDITNMDMAQPILLMLADKAAARMRDDEVYAACVSVSVRYSDFTHAGKQVTIEPPTNSTTDIYDYACMLLQSLWDESRPIRQLGVRATKVTGEKFEQLSLWNSVSYDDDSAEAHVNETKNDIGERYARADKAMDELRKKMGDDVIKRASQIK